MAPRGRGFASLQKISYGLRGHGLAAEGQATRVCSAAEQDSRLWAVRAGGGAGLHTPPSPSASTRGGHKALAFRPGVCARRGTGTSSCCGDRSQHSGHTWLSCAKPPRGGRLAAPRGGTGQPGVARHCPLAPRGAQFWLTSPTQPRLGLGLVPWEWWAGGKGGQEDTATQQGCKGQMRAGRPGRGHCRGASTRTGLLGPCSPCQAPYTGPSYGP